jgi:plasmid stabilization system protein ParE
VDFKLVWTESAHDDLGAIVRYIASQSGSDVAKKIGFELYDRVQILENHPEAGNPLPEKDDFRWRKLIHLSWKIAYRIDFDRRLIYIARIWHAARNEIDIK